MPKNRTVNERSEEGEPESDQPQDHLVRLNKFMAELGVASRRRCDELIVAGKVTVDGEPAVQLGMKIDPERSVVDVNGVVLKPLEVRKRYYLLNKPRRVVCTNEPREQRPRAIDLITDRNKGRIFSVGRLDEDSSGLLILTNDGDFTNQISHPRHSVPKTYLVKVRGRIDDAALAKITEGVRLSEGKTSRAAIHVERLSNEASVLTITIREGKNREIRRVFAAMGYKVLRLHRVRIGALSDRRLKDGEWRPLTPEEVADLLHIAQNRERAEELFERAAAGSFIPKPSADDDEERPRRESHGRERSPGAHRETSSRFGGTRREWHEPKDFRIKSASRKPRFDPAAARKESERGSGEAPAREERAPRSNFKAQRDRPAGVGRTIRPKTGGRSSRPESSGRGYAPKSSGRPDRAQSTSRGDRPKSTGRVYRPKATGRGDRSKAAPVGGGRSTRAGRGGRR
ncbi:MAG TPA: pseudouridine synthase [Planctomycetota bacterium]|nr:pseudouridine synthase [Planctomycetota bacterium]